MIPVARRHARCRENRPVSLMIRGASTCEFVGSFLPPAPFHSVLVLRAFQPQMGAPQEILTEDQYAGAMKEIDLTMGRS